MKHLQHTIETPLQHVQHPDLLLKYPDATLATYQKKRQMKHLRHASETLATYVYNKQMKYWGYTLATYMYNHYNIYNITIYFCNIPMKQLKHTSGKTETLETWACNMSEKHPETLETQHHRAAMTYLVGKCSGVGSLDGVRPHAPAMPAVG
jgi:hypothetical protein